VRVRAPAAGKMTPRGFGKDVVSPCVNDACEQGSARSGAEADAAASSIEPLEAAWPDLPEATRRQILALVRSHAER
jgi:hypothetical protein